MFGKEEPGIFESAPTEHTEHASEKKDTFVPQPTFGTAAERARRNLNAKLANPLAGYSHEELRRQGITFAINHQMGDESDIRAFELGAVLAQAPEKYTTVTGLTPEELQVLQHEFEHRWSQPWTMYLVIVLCSLSAAVQGMGKYPSSWVIPDQSKLSQMKPSSMARKCFTSTSLASTIIARDPPGLSD